MFDAVSFATYRFRGACAQLGVQLVPSHRIDVPWATGAPQSVQRAFVNTICPSQLNANDLG